MRLRELICRVHFLATIDKLDRLDNALTAPRGLSGVEIHPDGWMQTRNNWFL